MKNIESNLNQEVKRMTRYEIIGKAIQGELKWVEAANILGVSARHMLRLRERYENFGIEGMRDKRTGRRMPSRIPKDEVEEVCRLKREVYPDFTTKHFHRFAVAKHGVKMSYSWALTILQARGLVTPERSRGTYRRRRERRAMLGMMLHQDASTHTWIAGIPMQDLVVTMDDATSRILHAKFHEQEGTRSTLDGISYVLRKHGRFCEFYTDRGSHYCHTTAAGEAPDPEQDGQVARVLQALGIRHIRARSPQARGRSERAFKTIQEQLVPELRLAGIRTYEAANAYLERSYVPAYNRRHAVAPAQPESVFTSMVGMNLDLLLSVQHDRVVRNDNTVMFERLGLQLPSTAERFHFARCKVVVHEFLDDTIGVSFQGRLVGRFTRDGATLKSAERPKKTKRKAA